MPELVDQSRRVSATNLLTATAHQMRLNLQRPWDCRKPSAAAMYLARRCRWVERPASPGAPWILEEMHAVAKTMRRHSAGAPNYFRLRMTSGVIDSVNSLAQAARPARACRNAETCMTVIYLIAGRLRFDLPAVTHSR